MTHKHLCDNSTYMAELSPLIQSLKSSQCLSKHFHEKLHAIHQNLEHVLILS